ncbi:MAG: DUF6464 family protein [Waterburya sp.]
MINSVIKLALILLLSILPSLVYLLIFRRAKERWQMRLRRAQIFSVYDDREQSDYDSYRYHNSSSYLNDYSEDSLRNRDYPSETMNSTDLLRNRDRRRPVTKYFIGDTTCINNANSPYLRCAINPSGPCEGCVHYEERFHN